MKSIYRLVLLLVGFALISSCSKDDFDINPVLDLSKEALSFTKSGGVQSVIVTKNDDDHFFYLFKNEGKPKWIDINPTASGFDIHVQENTTLKERSVSMTVLLKKGNLTKSLTVTQSETEDVLLNLSTNLLEFEKAEGEQSVYITTNSTEAWEVTVDPSVDWLTIDETDRSRDKFKVVVTEKTDIKGRETVIKVSVSGVESMITVAQKGYYYFEFPFLDMNYKYDGPESERGIQYPNSIGSAAIYEAARESTLKSIISGGSGYMFDTKSEVFPVVGYGLYQEPFSPVIPAVRNAIMTSPLIKPFDLLEDADFQKHLAKERFELAYKNDDTGVGAYWSPDRQIVMQVNNFDGSLGNRFTFVHSRDKPNDPVNQTDSYTTFGEFPNIFMEWGESIDRINLWESEMGSTINEIKSSICTFTPDQELEPNILERAYYLDENNTPATLTKVLILCNYIDLAFYHTGSIYENQAYTITREFNDFIKGEGYTFSHTTPSGYTVHHIYTNVATNTRLSVFVNRFSTEGMTPRLCLVIVPLS